MKLSHPSALSDSLDALPVASSGGNSSCLQDQIPTHLVVVVQFLCLNKVSDDEGKVIHHAADHVTLF